MTPDWLALQEEVLDLLNQGKPEAAQARLQPILDRGAPPLLWRMQALALRHQGQIAQALAIQEPLLAQTPGDMELRFDIAENLLLQGDFDRGWREYRFRYRLARTRPIERKVQVPRWEGQAIPGQTLLIHDEQGLGDTLQFLRLVPQVAARSGARIILQVVEPLLSLARGIGHYHTLVGREELPPPFHQHCELLSLPLALKLQLKDLPGPMPYLHPDPARVLHWQARLSTLPRPWVALVWAGNPIHPNDQARSMKLADFAPLARPDVSFIALQKGEKAAQALQPPPGMKLLALDKEIRDFDDSAALLSLADLLITVDSSPAHLAGSLGRPAWVLLPLVPDWRWLMDRSDSPWYPSLRLFRQSARGDWAGVMARVAEALDTWKGTR